MPPAFQNSTSMVQIGSEGDTGVETLDIEENNVFDEQVWTHATVYREEKGG